MPPSTRYAPDPRHPCLGPLFFDAVAPADFPEATLRYRNQAWAERVGLGGLTPEEWTAHFARFEPLPGNLPEPLALRYHGHQFRTYNPDIGDGRGFLFAQLRDPETGRLLDLATKGSGQTPYSRSGDGRLTLKGGVREVLATEMLEAHGVSTSKTFSLIETGEPLHRGDEPSPTRSAVLVRLGWSHVRIGTFQRLAAHGETAALKKLLDYCIETYHPSAADAENRAGAFLAAVCACVAETAGRWTAAGFVHGVLNTDNIVVTGESFDYGPWRFLPTFEPGFTAAYFDHSGLYAFARQPEALFWNLERLAECLLVMGAEQAPLEDALRTFGPAFQSALHAALFARLGLETPAAPEERSAVNRALFDAMAATDVPFERALFDLAGGADPSRLAESPVAAVYRDAPFEPVLAALRDCTPKPGAAEALGAAPAAPPTLLWEEVEALWAPIAEKDDWSAFDGKIADIRSYGRLLAALREG